MTISIVLLVVIVVASMAFGFLVGLIVVAACVMAERDPREKPGHCGTCGGLLDYSKEDSDDAKNE